MIVGMGKASGSIDFSSDTSDEKTRIGTIIFVCEYLLGFSQAMFSGMAFQEPDAEKRSGLNKEERKLCRNGNIFLYVNY